MENEYGTRQPQRDVPVEQIIHYIVKDYQRMYNTFGDMQERAEKAEAKADELKEKLSKARSDNERIRKGFEKNLSEVRASRDAVVQQVTEDLQEQLKQTQEQLKASVRQNKLLAQAIAEPTQAKEILETLNEPILIASPEDKDRLAIAMKQLEVALLRMNSIEMRLGIVERAMELRYTGEELKNALKRFSNAYGKIDSVTMRLNNFLDMMKDLKIE